MLPGLFTGAGFWLISDLRASLKTITVVCALHQKDKGAIEFLAMPTIKKREEYSNVKITPS